MGHIFHDRDLDGKRDRGEEGLAGWEISVSSVPNDSNGSAISEADGSYRIEGLDPTTPERIFFASPAGEWPADLYYGLTLSQPQSLDFKNNAASLDIPVAYSDNTAVTFRVWEDFDGDNAISAGDEPALWTGVVIETPEGLPVFGASGPVSSLIIRGLIPGEYVARSSISPLDEAQFRVNETTSSDGLVEMLESPQITFYGHIYEDANGNGARDSGERGLSGAQFDLETVDADGTSVSWVADTESNGSYVLTDPSWSDEDMHVGCSYYKSAFNERGERISPSGTWRGTVGMFSRDGWWIQEKPVTITPGVYRYPVDCGLVFEPLQTEMPPIVPVCRESFCLPPLGTGSKSATGVSYLAPVLAALGALALLSSTRLLAQKKRPDR